MTVVVGLIAFAMINRQVARGLKQHLDFWMDAIWSMKQSGSAQGFVAISGFAL
jgi:hypothetical protein